jgi:putative ATP-dependent endonuclease of the OLD family
LDKGDPLAINRGIKIALNVECIRSGARATALQAELKDLAENHDEDDIAERFEGFGGFHQYPDTRSGPLWIGFRKPDS